MSDGGIQLYWRPGYLIEDSQWFAKHDYDVFEFACDTWESRDVMLSPRIKKRGFLIARRYKIEFISIIAGA